jgi:hypothetical protein
MKRWFCFVFGWLLVHEASAQRTYTENSVLSTGTWYRIAVSDPGVYKIDASFLNSLGIQGAVSSASIRLYGNGGKMLPENNAVPRPDDLIENAIQVEDGGDGTFNGADFFLFFADGPDEWIRDSVNKRFSHQKNLYSGESFYYITIAGTGKRILPQLATGQANIFIENFDERYFHELDTVNFLASGKEWYGEEFSATPGRVSSRDFTISLPGLVLNTPVTVSSDVIARSVGQQSSFDVRLNNIFLYQHVLQPLPGVLYEPVATGSSLTATTNLSENKLLLNFSFSPGSVNGQGWLNWFEIFCTRDLNMNGQNQLRFRHWNNIAPGNTAEFILKNAGAATRIWEVTDPQQPIAMAPNAGLSDSRFRNDCSRLREYIAFTGNGLLAPRPLGRISNQNLHRPVSAGMIIITTKELFDEAKRLADHHLQRENLVSVIADIREIYQEFSAGSPDPAAIRDYVKMFYDRAGTDSVRRPRYLLLFGDASFDYRNRIQGNTNLVPAYQSSFSLDPLTTFTSDDFFGFLDDTEDINILVPQSYLDIGIGRIPAEIPAEAKIIVDKIIRYHSPASLGPWRNQLSFVADDEDQNVHLNDAELHTDLISAIAPEWNVQKTYLDAYRQESGTGGSRYPQVNESINSRIFNGTMIWNYSGHGGNKRLAQEAILDEEMVNSWRNENKLPLFITATCDFAPFDNPLTKSIGEKILVGQSAGGIALMTTTRLVFAFSNRVINNNYLRFAMQRQANGNFLTLGDAVRQTKNFTYQNSNDYINNRKFTLLGDPAITLGFPSAVVRTSTINGLPAAVFSDTIKALNRYTISGEVTDLNGILLNSFNGTVYPSIYDKDQTVSTLANDPGSQLTNFQVQQNLLYNGKIKVINGKFSFTFIVPKDINYQAGKGRISYYADDGNKEANGLNNEIIIGGLGNEVMDDGDGPGIKGYLNDEKFVNGGLTSESPVLIIKLTDSSGINTVGTGIGHNLTAVIDGNTRETIILNDFYEADADSYQSGKVRFQMPGLEEGFHTITIKAWDVFNNSSEYLLECQVVKKEELAIKHVLNYPNPFTTRTQFWFEHNRPGEELQVSIQVMTVSGKLVKTIVKTIKNEGNRSSEIEWDGRDDYGGRLGRGVYIYRLRVRSGDGKVQEKLEKLLIL